MNLPLLTSIGYSHLAQYTFIPNLISLSTRTNPSEHSHLSYIHLLNVPDKHCATYNNVGPNPGCVPSIYHPTPIWCETSSIIMSTIMDPRYLKFPLLVLCMICESFLTSTSASSVTSFKLPENFSFYDLSQNFQFFFNSIPYLVILYYVNLRMA